MRYGHLAWPDVKELDKDKIVILPLGSCEQHGPHMPLLTDTLLVTAFAEAVEEEMGDDLLLLPTMWMGMSDHHLPFPGTVTANPELYSRWILRALETLVHHGIRLESPMLTHADEWEYSLALHVFPDICQPDKVKAIPTTFKTDYYDVDLSKQVISLSTPFTAFLPSGAANRPELASVEKGRALFDAFLQDLLTFFHTYQTWKEHPSTRDMGIF